MELDIKQSSRHVGDAEQVSTCYGPKDPKDEFFCCFMDLWEHDRKFEEGEFLESSWSVWGLAFMKLDTGELHRVGTVSGFGGFGMPEAPIQDFTII